MNGNKDINGHAYGEAFMLMPYEDELGNVEIIWNSRDGISPFFIFSRAGREMNHKDWNADVYVPNHRPLPGDRIFVDMTKEELLEAEKKMVDKYWDAGECSMKDHPVLGPLGKEGAAQYIVDVGWKKGMPNIVEVE